MFNSQGIDKTEWINESYRKSVNF